MSLALLYWAVLDIGYRFYVFPVHSGVGFELTPHFFKYTEALVLYFVLLCSLNTKFIKPSDFFVVVLFYAQITPILVFYGLTAQDREFLYIVLLSFLVINFLRQGRIYPIPFMRGGEYLSLGVALAGTVSVTIWFFVSGAVAYLNFDFTKVYDYRAITGGMINQGYFSYLNNWAYKAFGPVLMALALWRGKLILALAIMGLHVFWFAVSAHKAVMFYPCLVIATYIFFRYFKSATLIPAGISALVIACLLIYLGTGENYPASLFIRRLLFVVADNTFQYFNFFSEHPFVYWSQSITGSLINYPYQDSPPVIIANYRYGGDSVGYANNSFLSAGFMHAGLAGALFYAIVVGVMMRLIDTFSSRLPLWLGTSLVVVPVWTLFFSADLPTTLLTHGLGISIFMMALIGVDQFKQYPQRSAAHN